MLKKGFWKFRLFAVLRKKKPLKSVLGLSSPCLITDGPQQPKDTHIISLLSLPNEILLMIADILERPTYIYRLIQTNHRLACLLTPHLHRSAIQDRQGIPALHWAAERGHEGLVRLLLQNGVDVNIQDPMHRGWTALHLAARDHEPVVRLLLEMKADVSVRDRFDKTALHRAVHGVNGEVIMRLLLESGADVDAQDFLGHTALHQVIQQDSRTPALLELLLDFRASVSLKNVNGETPIHEAAKISNPQSMILLLKRGVGATINDVDSYGRTALHLAVSTSSKALELLLHSNPDLNIQNANGSTALHIATMKGCECSARKLVGKGADLAIKDNNGKTASDLARELEFNWEYLER